MYFSGEHILDVREWVIVSIIACCPLHKRYGSTQKKKNSDDDTKTTIWEIDHNTPCKLIYSSTTSFHLLTAWRKKDRNKESLGDSDDGDDNNNNKISNKRNHRLPFTKGSITIPCMLHFHVNNSIITISYNPHVDNIDWDNHNTSIVETRTRTLRTERVSEMWRKSTSNFLPSCLISAAREVTKFWQHHQYFMRRTLLTSSTPAQQYLLLY